LKVKPRSVGPAVIISALLATLLFVTAGAAAVEARNETHTATVVLILDDMGNSRALGLEALALPGAINYAFLPHSPNTAELAQTAHRLGKEVMLHAPMSNLRNLPLGPGALTAKMNKHEFLTTLRSNLSAVPHAQGINNHMGSLLTQLREPMTWLATELKQQNLYFIDSRTSPRTIAAVTATQYAIPTLKRDIFLDNSLDSNAIAAQFERLIRLAASRGVAVGIGHPHPETLRFLKKALPTLAERGITLAFASASLPPIQQH